MKIVKCKICNAEISEEKCVFTIHKRVIDGEEYHFCCELNAKEFQLKRNQKKDRN